MNRPVTPASREYVRSVRAARKTQLRLTTATVTRLVRTYNDAAEDISRRLLSLAEEWTGTEEAVVRRAVLEAVLRDIHDRLREFSKLSAERLRGGMLAVAQNVVDREVRVQEALDMLDAKDPFAAVDFSETFTDIDGTPTTVRFGIVAHDAVEALATRYYRDGLRLSDRIWRIEQSFRRAVSDTLLQAVAEGLSIEDTMDLLMDGPLAKESVTAHEVARLARTELAHAHTEAHLKAVRDPRTGKLRDGVIGVKWQISNSHPKPDICDIWASHDSGHGPGVYSNMEAVPTDHPNGLCYTTTVLEAWPETAEWSSDVSPDPSKVASEDLEYYAETGDTIAQAALAARR